MVVSHHLRTVYKFARCIDGCLGFNAGSSKIMTLNSVAWLIMENSQNIQTICTCSCCGCIANGLRKESQCLTYSHTYTSIRKHICTNHTSPPRIPLLIFRPSSTPLLTPLTRLPTPNLRSRARIRRNRITIRIDRNARIILARIPRDIRQIISTRLCRTTPTDHNLRTLGVELRCIGLVQSQQLVTDQIVACRERGRDGRFPVQVLEHVVGAPGGAGEGRGGHAFLVDLELVNTRRR